jgi:hypothetical protein
MDRSSPVAIDGQNMPAGAVFSTIAAGSDFSVGVAGDGSLWAWGANNQNQLGDGTGVASGVPVRVSTQNMPAGVRFTKVSAASDGPGGAEHALALDGDGNVWAWGNPTFGALGDGGSSGGSRPVMVAMPAGVKFTDISAGADGSVAVGSDGHAWAWGDGTDGEIGPGSGSTSVPVQVTGLSGVTQVAAGWDYNMALTGDGTLYSWGRNSDTDLAGGNNSTPTAVPSSGVPYTQISTGGYGDSAEHTLALGNDGKVYAFGFNGSGQVGDGTTQARSTPVAVSGLANVTEIAAGAFHSLALTSDGQAWAWGSNSRGQLGSGATASDLPNSSVPVSVGPIPGNERPYGVSAGPQADHSAATTVAPPGSCDRKTNAVCDGGFETPVVNTTVGWQEFGAGDPIGQWTVAEGSVDIQSSRWEGWQSAAGSQSLDLNGSSPGAVYQDVPTTPGAAYRLSFQSAANPDCGDEQTSLEVDWNGSKLDTIDWQAHTYSVPATSSTGRLMLRSLGPAGPCGPVVDDVSLSGDAGGSGGNSGGNGGNGGNGGTGGGPAPPNDNGAGAPAPTCGDHTESVGPFTIEAACFERHGATLAASGRIRVNGIDVAIDGSGSFTLDVLHRKLSASAPVTISLGSIQVYKGSFKWELTGPSIRIPKLPSLKIKGLPVAGKLSAEAKDGGRTSITADARVGAADGPAVTGELKLSLSNDLGLQLDHAKLALSQVGIKALLLKDASLSYDRTAEGEDQWTGALTLVLPKELPTVDGKVVLLNGRLSEVALNATDINKWIGGFVYLQKLGLDVKLIPTLDVTGLLGLSAGPSIPGVSPAAFTLDSSLEATFGNPVVIDLKGNLKAAGEVDLAQAEAKWTVPNRFEMNGHAGFAKEGVGIDLNVSGGVDPRGFWLYGQGSVTVPHVGSANGLGYVSEKGITACASVTESNLGLFDTTVGGGFGYHWGGGLDLWFDDCGALAFKSAAQSAGAHGAGVNQPVDLRVPAGQNQTIFGARGVSDYPSFTLRSPSGEVIDPATGDRGGVDNNAYLWVTDPGRHGTYVIVAHPRPGAWRLTPKPGSPAIATVGSALSAPPPHVASRVRYRAGRYSLSWNARVAPADELRFVENAGDTERVVLDVRKTKGVARIRPADTGRGEQRQISVQLLRRGLIQSILKGPRFRVLPPPKPLPTRRIKIVRHGTNATVSWQRAPRAAAYDVWLITSDGRRLYFHQPARAPSVRLARVTLPLRVRASLTTLAGDGLRSRTAHATFKLTAHRRRRP